MLEAVRRFCKESLERLGKRQAVKWFHAIEMQCSTDCQLLDFCLLSGLLGVVQREWRGGLQLGFFPEWFEYRIPLYGR